MSALANPAVRGGEVVVPHVRVARPRELGAAELDAWRSFQARDQALGSPFLSPAFALAVDRVRDDARVAVLEDSRSTVGFLAFQQGRFGAGRPIAATACDRQAVVAAPGLHFDPAAILRGCRLSVLEFDHLVASQPTFEAHHVARCQSYVMELGGGYDAYLAGRLASSRKQLRRTLDKRGRLEAAAGRVELELRTRDPRELRRLMAWKSAQFRRSGWPDRFREGWLRGLVEALFDSADAGCAGFLSVLRAGGAPVAYLYALVGNGTAAAWFPAYDPAFRHFSPGLLLHLDLAERAASAGLREIDLGRGHEPYKDLLKTRDVDLAEAWVATRGMGALLRRVQRLPRDRVWAEVKRHDRLHRPARWVLRRAFSMGRP
jgi:CelD/BcsL family acetyltransferase involved in cellulose biosynthesis